MPWGRGLCSGHVEGTEHSELGVQHLRSGLVHQAKRDVPSRGQVEADINRLARIEDAEELDD